MKSYVATGMFLVILLALSACGNHRTSSLAETSALPNPAVTERATSVPVETEAALSASQIENRPCSLYMPKGETEGKTIQCGYVVVPALRDREDSKQVKLAFVILKATGKNPQRDAIIHIAGGPGLASTNRDAVLEMMQRYAPLRVAHDVILYDQRGVGKSQPFFDCYSFLRDTDTSEMETDRELSVACQKGMIDQGYPPEAFSTRVAAADLNDLMRAFRYPSYNLYGISYGTRLLMAFMHYYPSQPLVRAVVLDSVDTLPENIGSRLTVDGQLLRQKMFETVFDACVNDRDCSTNYPDLRTRFDTLVSKLNENPIGLGDDVQVDGESIYHYLFPYNGAVQNIPYEPRVIDELDRGVTTTLSMIANGEIPAPSTLTMAMPPEPDGVSDLVDAFLDCMAPEPKIDDNGNEIDPLVGYWDADADKLESFLNDICPADVAATMNQAIAKEPGIFNYIIIRFSPDTTSGLASDFNDKLFCTETYPFRDSFDKMTEAMTAAGMPAFYITDTIDLLKKQIDTCDVWQDAMKKPTPTDFGEYPVLVLSGQFDDITPPAWSETAASLLPDARLVAIPNAAHSILGNNGSCPTDITRQFYDNPGGAIDDSCTKDMKVVFMPPAGSEHQEGSAGAPGLNDPLYADLGNGGYDVQHYDIALLAAPDQGTISGTTTIEALALQDLQAFNVDFAGLTVSAVSVDGEPAKFKRAGSEMTIIPAHSLDNGAHFAVQVRYHVQPKIIRDESAPVALGWQPQSGGSMVISEPSGAMNWFPGNNHPADKASYTFRISVPSAYEVAANGVLSKTLTKSGKTTYIWEMA